MTALFQFIDIYRLLDSQKRFIHISGEAAAGEILCIQGPSGAGKSTLLKILARLLPAERGTVLLQDRDWFSYSPQEWRLLVHYLSQTPVLFDGTVEDNLNMPFSLKNLQDRGLPARDRILRLLDELKLSGQILSQSAVTLSGGESARIGLIRALLIDPIILMLDEPTAHLDKDSALAVMHLINRWVAEAPERGVILISHNQEDLQELSSYSFLTIEHSQEDSI